MTGVCVSFGSSVLNWTEVTDASLELASPSSETSIILNHFKDYKEYL
jgi:hypothetical protein